MSYPRRVACIEQDFCTPESLVRRLRGEDYHDHDSHHDKSRPQHVLASSTAPVLPSAFSHCPAYKVPPRFLQGSSKPSQVPPSITSLGAAKNPLPPTHHLEPSHWTDEPTPLFLSFFSRHFSLDFPLDFLAPFFRNPVTPSPVTPSKRYLRFACRPHHNAGTPSTVDRSGPPQALAGCITLRPLAAHQEYLAVSRRSQLRLCSVSAPSGLVRCFQPGFNCEPPCAAVEPLLARLQEITGSSLDTRIL